MARGITFEVDPVVADRSSLEETPLAAQVVEEHQRPALACSAGEVLKGWAGANGLWLAVHLAYAEHRPLVLGPDEVWLTIAQGFARHLRYNAAALTADLVGAPGQRVLTVGVEGLPEDAEGWSSVVRGFGGELETRHPEIARLLRCDFSTTTAEAALASEIVLMDAMSPWYQYELMIICGIPEITLLGTPEDWEEIARRVGELERYGLGWWTRRLEVVTAQLVRAARGDVDRAFWRCIYKNARAYGHERINGWLCWLFPWLGAADQDRAPRRNPTLDVDLLSLEGFAGSGQSWSLMGVALPQDATWMTSSEVPPGTVTVEVELRTVNAPCLTLELRAGTVGVSQGAGGALRPRIGWYVIEAPAMLDTLKALAPRVEAGPGEPGPRGADVLSRFGMVGVSDDVVRFYRAFPGGVRLAGYHNGAEVAVVPVEAVRGWGLRHVVEGEGVVVWELGLCWGRVGEHAALVQTRGFLNWRAPQEAEVLLWPDEAPAAERVPVIAESLEDFLSRVRDSGDARYFEAPGFEPLRWLGPLMRKVFPADEERFATMDDEDEDEGGVDRLTGLPRPPKVS